MKLQPVLCHLVYDVALSDVFLRYPPEGACWVGTEKTTLKKWRRKYVSFFFKRFFFFPVQEAFAQADVFTDFHN